MLIKFKQKIRNWLRRQLINSVPEIKNILVDRNWFFITKELGENIIGQHVLITGPAHVYFSEIGDYTYVALNSYITHSTIGKCCSIGPNLVCGWGIHPLDGISTHPMFFSTQKQNGMTLSSIDKIEERKRIHIGNDVFIGANVTILDGITIGDGAVIGAGAVVSKDIPPYAIAVGVPIKILRYRFSNDICKKLQETKWWDLSENDLKKIEEMEFDVENFLKNYNDYVQHHVSY